MGIELCSRYFINVGGVGLGGSYRNSGAMRKNDTESFYVINDYVLLKPDR